jgi:hypothetical protein
MAHNNDDTHASLSISKRGYHCFGCGISGNTIELVKRLKHLDTSQAYDWLRDNFGAETDSNFCKNILLAESTIDSAKKTEPTDKKRHIRFIDHPKRQRYGFLPEKDLTFDEPTVSDSQAIYDALKKWYCPDTLIRAGISINRSNKQYGIIFSGTEDILFNPDSHSVLLHLEGRTDYLTALEIKLDKHYGIVNHFNKTVPVNLSSGQHVFIMDADDSPEQIKSRLKISGDVQIKFIRIPNGHKDISDWYNNQGISDKDVLALIDATPWENNKEANLASPEDNNGEQEIEDFFVPPLPDGCLVPPELAENGCPVLDEYVEFSKKWSPRAAQSYHSTVFVVLLSGITARRLFFNFGSKRFTNLYSLIVGPSSLFAKTTTLNIGKKLIERLDLSELMMFDCTPPLFIKSLAGELPEKYHKLSDEKKVEILRRLRYGGKSLWIYEEFGAYLTQMMNQSSIYHIYHYILREFDDCPNFHHSGSVTRGEDKILNPYLSLIGNLTYADLQPFSRTNSKLWNDGFFARFGFATPSPDERPIMSAFPDEVFKLPENIVNALMDYHERLGIPDVQVIELPGDNNNEKSNRHYQIIRGKYPETEIKISKDSLDALNNYSNGLHKLIITMNNEDLNSAYSRFPEKALRIAAMLAFLQGSLTIEIRHLAKAQIITEMWRSSLHQLYKLTNSQPDREKETEEKIKALLARRDKAMTVREIQQTLTKLSSDKIARACSSMAMAGSLRTVERKRPNGTVITAYELEND